MIECRDCIKLLGESRLTDFGSGSAVLTHCATCPDCGRLREEIRYAERRLAIGLNESGPGIDSFDVAGIAIQSSEMRRRRRIARWLQGGLGLGACAIFGVFMATHIDSPSSSRLQTEVVDLQCLTEAEAVSVVTPVLRSSGSVVYHHDDLKLITLRARPAEMHAAIETVRGLDARQCARMDAERAEQAASAASNSDLPATSRRKDPPGTPAPPTSGVKPDRD